MHVQFHSRILCTSQHSRRMWRLPGGVSGNVGRARPSVQSSGRRGLLLPNSGWGGLSPFAPRKRHRSDPTQKTLHSVVRFEPITNWVGQRSMLRRLPGRPGELRRKIRSMCQRRFGSSMPRGTLGPSKRFDPREALIFASMEVVALAWLHPPAEQGAKHRIAHRGDGATIPLRPVGYRSQKPESHMTFGCLVRSR